MSTPAVVALLLAGAAAVVGVGFVVLPVLAPSNGIVPRPKEVQTRSPCSP